MLDNFFPSDMTLGCGRTARGSTTGAHTAGRTAASDACPLGKGFNVNKVEPLVWRYVSTLLQDPSKVHGGLEVLTDWEREGTRRDADREAKAWLDSIAEADTMRRGF
jgi:hypothetical protein